MKNVLVIPWAYEELNLVQFFKEYMLACFYMLIRQFGRIRFIVHLYCDSSDILPNTNKNDNNSNMTVGTTLY